MSRVILATRTSIIFRVFCCLAVVVVVKIVIVVGAFSRANCTQNLIAFILMANLHQFPFREKNKRKKATVANQEKKKREII